LSLRDSFFHQHPRAMLNRESPCPDSSFAAIISAQSVRVSLRMGAAISQMKRTWIASVVVAVLAVFTVTAAAQGTEMTWTVDGVERVALVYAPAALGAKLPII